MVYWNAGKRLVCEVMSCHPVPPIPTEHRCLIGPRLMMVMSMARLRTGLLNSVSVRN